MRIFQLLLPSRQNTPQRVGFFITLALLASVLMLHYPFDGYSYQDSVVIKHGIPNCDLSRPDLNQLKSMNVEQLSEYVRRYNAEAERCGEIVGYQTRPILDWVSQSSIVDWFAPISSVLISVCFILSLGLLWLWIFRRQNGNSDNS